MEYSSLISIDIIQFKIDIIRKKSARKMITWVVFQRFNAPRVIIDVVELKTKVDKSEALNPIMIELRAIKSVSLMFETVP